MYYYTTNTYNDPYTWTTNSTSTVTTSKTYNPTISWDCSGWTTHVVKKQKGLDKEKVTEDMIMDLLKDDDK